MKTFKSILQEAAAERTNIEKTVSIGRNPKTSFTLTRTDEGVIGIEYGDKGNVVFIFGNEKRQLIDLLQGK
tara:strand:+ start:136 stop:348 length:213 start_codon:yes stop_codon:yes gene_type:complete